MYKRPMTEEDALLKISELEDLTAVRSSKEIEGL